MTAGLAGVDSSLFDSIYSQCSIYLAVVILVNLLALYVSLTTFVMPLERLASKLKHNPGGTKVPCVAHADFPSSTLPMLLLTCYQGVITRWTSP